MTGPSKWTAQTQLSATARTLLDERPGVRVEVIEAGLAHSVSYSLGRAYNRTTFIDDRAKMMQSWADYLDELAASEPVRLRLAA